MNLDTVLEFTHLNIRRERAGSAARGPLAVDMKLVGKVKAVDLAGLFSSQAGWDALLGGLWRVDGTLITTDVASIELTQEGVGVHVDLLSSRDDALKVQFAKGTTLNKLSLEPQPGRICIIECRLQARPTKEQLGELGEMLEDTLRVKVDAAQMELELPKGEAAAPTTESPDVNEPGAPDPELPQWEAPPPAAAPVAAPHFLGKDAAGQRVYRRHDGALLVAVREGAVEELVEVPEVDLVDPTRKLVDTRSKQERMAADTADAL